MKQYKIQNRSQKNYHSCVLLRGGAGLWKLNSALLRMQKKLVPLSTVTLPPQQFPLPSPRLECDLLLLLDKQLVDEVPGQVGHLLECLVLVVVLRDRHIRHRLQVRVAHEGGQSGHPAGKDSLFWTVRTHCTKR